MNPLIKLEFEEFDFIHGATIFERVLYVILQQFQD